MQRSCDRKWGLAGWETRESGVRVGCRLAGALQNLVKIWVFSPRDLKMVKGLIRGWKTGWWQGQISILEK